MPKQILPQLMFVGDASDAIDFYTSLFPDSEIVQCEKYGPGGPGPEGTIQRAIFTVAGREFACIDSPGKHEFTFTPSISIFVECDSEEELRSTFERLSEGGKVLMPLNDYGFSTLFGWTDDRFGVSWQLNLA